MTTAADILEFVFMPDASIRAVVVDGKPWFVAVDVCKILGLGNPAWAIRHLDDDEKSITIGEAFRRRGDAPWLINDSGLYALIMRSRKLAWDHRAEIGPAGQGRSTTYCCRPGARPHMLQNLQIAVATSPANQAHQNPEPGMGFPIVKAPESRT